MGFLFNDTATTEIYTLSLHDALPISQAGVESLVQIRGRSTCDVKLVRVIGATRCHWLKVSNSVDSFTPSFVVYILGGTLFGCANDSIVGLRCNRSADNGSYPITPM